MTASDAEKHDPDSSVIAWLLDSDPSIRWQVKRDLLHEPDERVAWERGRIAREGFSYPPTYHYDILRGLDYLRDAGVAPDERIADAVELVAKKRRPNGRWPLENPHPDRIPFEMEGDEGVDSRWNTLRALRVLNWFAAKSGRG